jgi:hypothetical protein
LYAVGKDRYWVYQVETQLLGVYLFNMGDPYILTYFKVDGSRDNAKLYFKLNALNDSGRLDWTPITINATLEKRNQGGGW